MVLVRFWTRLNLCQGEHLAKVAKRAGTSEDRVDEMVEPVNATLGWDIGKCLGPMSDEQ